MFSTTCMGMLNFRIFRGFKQPSPACMLFVKSLNLIVVTIAFAPLSNGHMAKSNQVLAHKTFRESYVLDSLQLRLGTSLVFYCITLSYSLGIPQYRQYILHYLLHLSSRIVIPKRLKHVFHLLKHSSHKVYPHILVSLDPLPVHHIYMQF